MGLRILFLLGFGLAAITGLAQSTNTLVEKTNTYFKAWPEPKLMLLFNQDKYSPGDTAYFRAFYQVDPEPVVKQELMDVFLIGARGNLILSHKFLIDNGVGAGQLILPDSLTAGLYLIMARTNWMRNFNKQVEHMLTVVEEYEVVPAATGSVKFRTESGQLVAGLQNQVYFNSDKHEAAYEIRDAQDQVVVKQSTNKWGSGSFSITAGSSYFLQWMGETTKHALPKAVDQGVVLNSALRGEELTIEAVTNQSVPLVVVITGNGSVLYAKEQPAGNFSLTIPRQSLTAGIAKLSVLTLQGKLVASRDFYVPKPTRTTQLRFNKDFYKPGERVEATFSTSGSDSWAIRVINTQTAAVNGYNHQAWLRAGFASPYPMDSVTQHQLDQWLLVETTDLPWTKILQPTLTTRYAPLNVIERSGQVYNSETQLPVEATTQVLLYLQRKKFIYQTFTGPDARISVAIPDLYNTDEFFYMAEYRGKPVPITIRWHEEERTFPKPPLFTSSTSPDAYGTFRSTIRLINDSFEAFGKIELPVTTARVTEFKSLMGDPDINLRIEDFIAFPTMNELIKEVVPSLSVRSNKNGSWVRVGLAMWIPTQDPVYLIDDRATIDTKAFLSLNPSDIISLGIYNTPHKLIRLGLMGKQGIVVVNTKSPDKKSLPADSANLIEGICEVVSFQFLKPGAAPVYRSTVYWNPALLGDKVSFPVGDDLGEMKVEGVGFVDGVISFVSAKFQVGLE